MPTPEGTKKKKAAPSPQAVPVEQILPKKLTRSVTDKMICGVCGGLAEYLSIDSVIIRLLFLILAFSGGSGVLIYVILCIVVPEKDSAAKNTKEVVEENSKNFEKTIEDVAANVEAVASRKNTQTWIGLAVILLGVMLMANNLGYVAFSDVLRVFFRTLWPVAIIAIGLVILTKSKNEK